MQTKLLLGLALFTLLACVGDKGNVGDLVVRRDPGHQIAYGDEKGNGGDVVVCRDAEDQITSIELLDFYEAREMREIEIDLGSPDSSMDTYLELFMKRLGRLSPYRVKKYRPWMDAFIEESKFQTGVTFRDIEDSKEIFFPKHCSVEQIVIQIKPERPKDKRYFINEDLWRELDEKNRAGLVMHEIIYREFKRFGAEDSISTRYFNSILASKEISSMSLEEFITTSHDIGVPVADWMGWVFDLRKKKPFFINGKLHRGYLYGRQNFLLPGGGGTLLPLRGPIVFHVRSTEIQEANLPGANTFIAIFGGRGFLLSPQWPFTMSRSGALETYAMPPQYADYYQTENYRLRPENQDGDDEWSVPLRLFEDGSIKLCHRCKGEVQYQEQAIKVGIHPHYYVKGEGREDPRTYPSVRYSKKGVLDQLVLAEPGVFEVLGRAVVLAENTSVDFREGVVNRAVLKNETMLPVGQREASFRGIILAMGGRLRYGILSKSATLPDKKGILTLYQPGMRMSFDREGKVMFAKGPWNQ